MKRTIIRTSPVLVLRSDGSIDWQASVALMPPERAGSRWEALKIAVGKELVKERKVGIK